jgi:hypothetical protein
MINEKLKIKTKLRVLSPRANTWRTDLKLQSSAIHHFNPVQLINYFYKDRLCRLVVRVPGYRSRGLGSIPDATRFSEK